MLKRGHYFAWGTRIGIAGACCAGLVLGCSRPREGNMEMVRSKKPSMFEREESQLERALCKITWLGFQKVPIWTVVIRTQRCDFSIAECRRFHSGDPGAYGNDTFAVKEIVVSPRELRDMLSRVQSVVQPLVGRPRDEGDLSFVVVWRAASEYEGVEARLDLRHQEAFYRAILGGLSAESKEAREVVRNQFDEVVPAHR